MNCPLCNVELKMSERQGVEIDYCSQCCGVWLHGGELDKIIERSISFPAKNKYENRNYSSLKLEDSHYKKKKKRKSFLGKLLGLDLDYFA
ncbi:MAG: zf-TFIIB domain-containing protein [Bacteroidales bacterium]|nr:zf-TFIIB domain-containing protein [Bacteroidales bacterium]